MAKQHTVCAALVNTRISELLQVGVAEHLIYEILGLNTKNLAHPEIRIPIQKLVTLEKAAPILTQCDHIAFKIAAECKNAGDSKTGIVGQVAASCKTVGEAFRSAVRYGKLVSDAVYMEVKEGEKYAEFICMRKAPSIYTLFEGETSIIDSYKILRQFGKVYEVHFMHNKPSYYQKYKEVFDCKLVFGSEVSKIIFSKEILNMQNPYSQPYVNHIMREHAEGLMNDMGNAGLVSGRVQSLIEEHISNGMVDINFVSAKMNMSRQSLYRKLKEEESTFSTLLDNIRKELATKHIRVKQHNMTEIAFLLGFSELSSFDRAHKRWFQKNPRRNR